MSAGYAERLSEYPNKVGGRIYIYCNVYGATGTTLTSYILS